MEQSNIILICFVPIMIYSKAKTEKSYIYTENKAGIFQWTHIKSGKIYIGSALNLSYRIKEYSCTTLGGGTPSGLSFLFKTNKKLYL